MPGHVPGIHVFSLANQWDVDGRDKPGHDEVEKQMSGQELAGKAAVRGELTEESTREQKGAGLDRCSPEEFARLQHLNSSYNEKFGFPFVIAVKGHNRQSILDNFERRLGNERDAEARECIEQIIKIGGFRLEEAVH